MLNFQNYYETCICFTQINRQSLFYVDVLLAYKVLNLQINIVRWFKKGVVNVIS